MKSDNRKNSRAEVRKNVKPIKSPSGRRRSDEDEIVCRGLVTIYRGADGGSGTVGGVWGGVRYNAFPEPGYVGRYRI